MTDVEKLLWLDHIATQLAGIKPVQEFEIVADPETIKAVANAMLQFDGSSWDDAGANRCVHAYCLAKVAITTFLQQVLRSAS